MFLIRRPLVREAEAQNIAVFGDMVYWAAKRAMRGVERANKWNGNDRNFVLSRAEPTDIIAVNYPSDKVKLLFCLSIRNSLVPIIYPRANGTIKPLNQG